MRNHHYFLWLILFCISLNVLAQDPWIRLSGDPTENQLNHIERIAGSNKLIAVGNGSTILISHDVGESWQTILNPAGMNNQYICKGICFIDENIGFIYGGKETILKTTDGGYHWEITYEGNPSHEWKCINDIDFVDDQKGFAIAEEGQLLKTMDQGDSWELMDSGVTFYYSDIEFADSLTGYIYGHTDYMLKTINGGDDWIESSFTPSLPDSYIIDLNFITDSLGLIALDEDGTKLYRTEDQGFTWTEVCSDWKVTSADAAEFNFFNEQNGFFSLPTFYGYTTSLFFTEDGGLTWTEHFPEDFSWYHGMDFCIYDENTVMSIGQYGSINKSVDGGLEYENKQQRIFNGSIYDLEVINENISYIIHDESGGGASLYHISKTIDGGNSWQFSINSFIRDPYIHFFNSDTGYLASWDIGFVFQKTFDGGNSWTTIETGIDMEPKAIAFYDLDHGLVVEGSHIYRTTDGGESWEEIYMIGHDVKDIEYKSSDEVFMVGWSSEDVILRSIDGGDSWEEIIVENYNGAVDICFINDEIAFLAGYNSIIKSIDGGLNWYTTNIHTEEWLSFNSVYFPSEAIGYAVGDGNYENIFKTIDGGENWYPMETFATSKLNFVHFFDDDNGWVFGDNGLFMTTSTGGLVSVDESISKDTTPSFDVYPNPASDILNIRLNQENHIEKAEIVLIDANGRTVKSYKLYDTVQSIQISISDYPKGMYLVQVISNKEIVETQKVIIQ